MGGLGSYSPRGDQRIIYISDPSSIVRSYLPEEPTEEDLRNWVDDLADAGVDTFIQEAYTQGWTTYWRCERFEYDQRPQHRCLLPLLDAGIQPLAVLIDQSHKRGMKFMAGLRINDDHGHVSAEQGVGAGSTFLTNNSQWKIKDLPPGDAYKLSTFIDFTFSEVRDYLISVAEELVKSFDLDGLELCFRDRIYFPAGKSRERESLMTDMVKKIHEMLYKESQVKGVELNLGARVCQTIDECHNMGLDVPTWISKGYLDYVSPSDQMNTDINAPYDEFTAITHAQDKPCYLYPAILPWMSNRSERRLNRKPLTIEQQRAVAQNYYGAGADGVSIYNHFVSNDWAPFYPMQLSDLDELRDPTRVAKNRKHYVFEPLWGGCTFTGLDRSVTGIIKADKIVLKRRGPEKSGSYRFRICEDLSKVRKASLLFRAGYMTFEDQIKVCINDEEIPQHSIRYNNNEKRIKAAPIETSTDRAIRMLKEGEGKLPVHDHSKKGDTFLHDPLITGKGHPVIQKEIDRPTMTCWFELNSPPAIYGDNWLQVNLTSGDPQAEEDIIIDEIEVWVFTQ
jgi:hypothetical protein